MKKFICIALAGVMMLSMTACGTVEAKQTAEATAVTEAKESVVTEAAKLTGAVSTDGSTSMEKVIGGLGEMFMEMNAGATFTYNPTGSSAGIKAIQEGRCDIGLSSRALKAEEEAQGLKATVLAAGIPIDAAITWASSDTTKATVSGGEVTGVAAGSAVITATAGSASAVCNVTVTS